MDAAKEQAMLDAERDTDANKKLSDSLQGNGPAQRYKDTDRINS